MSVTYVYDNQGNKYESMTKEEILESIGAGGLRENVFTGSVIYNYEEIPYEYNGQIPTDDIIVKLINCGLDYSVNLSQTEIENLLALGEFKIHIFLCESDLYITNGHCDCIYIYNSMLGIKKMYPRTSESQYYMKASEPIENIEFCTEEEFYGKARQEGKIYVVTDEDYTVFKAIHAEKANAADYATNAENANKATNDKSGNDIEKTYSKLDRVRTYTISSSNPIYRLIGGTTAIDLSSYLNKAVDQIIYLSGRLRIVVNDSNGTHNSYTNFNAPLCEAIPPAHITDPVYYPAYCYTGVFISNSTVVKHMSMSFTFFIDSTKKATIDNFIYEYETAANNITIYLQSLMVYYK